MKIPEDSGEILKECLRLRESLSKFFNSNQKYWGTPFMSAIARVMGEIETIKRIYRKGDFK